MRFLTFTRAPEPRAYSYAFDESTVHEDVEEHQPLPLLVNADMVTSVTRSAREADVSIIHLSGRSRGFRVQGTPEAIVAALTA